MLQVIADGIFISGSSVKTDEAAITGESDNVNKDAVRDPFMLSGTSMAAGTCNMLVTAVGVRSTQVSFRWRVGCLSGMALVMSIAGCLCRQVMMCCRLLHGVPVGGQGRIMADTAMEAKDTPLQEKLELLATRIGYFGFVFAILTFIAMIVSWFADKEKLKADYSQTEWIIHAIITSVTIIVVAIPEGLVRGRASETSVDVGRGVRREMLLKELSGACCVCMYVCV